MCDVGTRYPPFFGGCLSEEAFCSFPGAIAFLRGQSDSGSGSAVLIKKNKSLMPAGALALKIKYE